MTDTRSLSEISKDDRRPCQSVPIVQILETVQNDIIFVCLVNNLSERTVFVPLILQRFEMFLAYL